jgi:hypothetical protein
LRSVSLRLEGIEDGVQRLDRALSPDRFEARLAAIEEQLAALLSKLGQGVKPRAAQASPQHPARAPAAGAARASTRGSSRSAAAGAARPAKPPATGAAGPAKARAAKPASAKPGSAKRRAGQAKRKSP